MSTTKRERDRCPPAELLSAYVDGELDDRWRRELEEHLQECRQCRGVVAGLSRVRECLQEQPEIDFVDPMVRVRNALVAPLVERELSRGARGLWRRSVPLPAAVAAALVVLAVGFAVLWSVSRYRGSLIRITAAPTGLVQVEIEGRTPADVQALLDALNSGNSGRVVTFEIPRDYELVPFGDPNLRPAAGRRMDRW